MNTINTPYDDAFKTLLIDCPSLIIPVVNELFNTDYTGKEKIVFLQNEHYTAKDNESKSKKITDSFFEIQGQDIRKFHIECQSTVDGSMSIRMFEYDTQIALVDSEIKSYCIKVNFPESAVLFLRHNKNTPDYMNVTISAGGNELTYKILILKVQDYNLEEIFEKKLLFLIPFYIFSYESRFNSIENNINKLNELKNVYSDILKRLDTLTKNGEITEFERCSIINMTKIVIEGIAAKYHRLREEVKNIMGGKVLEYEAKTIRNQGREEGRNEGRNEGRYISLVNLINKNLITIEDAALEMGCSVEEFLAKKDLYKL